VWHHDGDGNIGARAGVSQRLTVIATRGCDDPFRRRPIALEPVKIDNPAAHLEGTDRRVVLMLDDDVNARQRF
jgi:Lon protease-like protein